MARETEISADISKGGPAPVPCPACGGIGKVEPTHTFPDGTAIVQPGFIKPCSACGGSGRATLKLYHVHAFKFPTAWASREVKATSPQEAFEKVTAEGADPGWFNDDFEIGADWLAPEYFRVTDPDSDEEAEFERNPDKIEIARLRAFLQEIAKGEGAYSMDPLKHADNTIENMKALAERALAGKPFKAEA